MANTRGTTNTINQKNRQKSGSTAAAAPKLKGKTKAPKAVDAKMSSANTKIKPKSFDYILFITVMILLGIGITMVFSSSSPTSFYRFDGDSLKFVKQQLLWAAIGFVAMMVMSFIDYRKLGKLSFPLLAVCFVLLVAVLILPRVGDTSAKRWISVLGLFVVQPSEITKYAVIVFFSFSLSQRQEVLNHPIKGLGPYVLIVGILSALILKEPHLSTTLIIVALAMILLFVAGTKLYYFIFAGAAVIPAAFLMVQLEPYRMKRLMAFMDPFNPEFIKGESWQVVQSLIAIGTGGWFGRGLGRSLQKFLYIPEPFNDFIFAIQCEELGFVGAFAVIVLYMIFIWRGIRIAMTAPDMYGTLLAVGITSLVGLQVILNIAVVTSSVPNTGQTLPLISYGGTSLMLLMTGIGMLLSVSRYCSGEHT